MSECAYLWLLIRSIEHISSTWCYICANVTRWKTARICAEIICTFRDVLSPPSPHSLTHNWQALWRRDNDTQRSRLTPKNRRIYNAYTGPHTYTIYSTYIPPIIAICNAYSAHAIVDWWRVLARARSSARVRSACVVCCLLLDLSANVSVQLSPCVQLVPCRPTQLPLLLRIIITKQPNRTWSRLQNLRRYCSQVCAWAADRSYLSVVWSRC